MTRNLIFFLMLTAIAACSNDADTNRVVGELASDRIELTAEVAEPIIEVSVREGTEVSAGETLLRQDDARAVALLAEADAALAGAKARLDELVRGPRSEQIRAASAASEGAERELEFREAEYLRAQEVHARGLASPEALDRAKANLDAAQASVRQQRAQLEEMLAGTTVEELAQAEQNVLQAQARRDRAAVDLDRHTLRAPVAGITDARLFEAGERPVPGQPVMIMLAGTQPYARVFVPEELRVGVTAGSDAQIYVDGLAEPISGRVRWVSADAAFTPYYALTERDRGRLSYIAKIDIVDERERLPDGVPVEVEFVGRGATQ